MKKLDDKEQAMYIAKKFQKREKFFTAAKIILNVIMQFGINR